MKTGLLTYLVIGVTVILTVAPAIGMSYTLGEHGTTPVNAATTLVGGISGTVFEDKNYGGGEGRNLANAIAEGGASRSGVRVEIYDAAGDFLSTTTTDAVGVYAFTGLAAGNYTIRVVNSTVSSARSGYLAGTHLAVQTYRTGAAGAEVRDRVGGESPHKVDAGNGTSTLAALSTLTEEAQSVVTVSLGAVNDITGVDFGFNFNVIVNVNSSGQGSLEQFIINANGLDDQNSLAQNGSRMLVDGTSEPLPAGFESSIFMISNGTARPGLRAGLVDQLTAGVAVFSPNAISRVQGNRTVLDGSTQTFNLGNTNVGLHGAGGTVGVDNVPLLQVPAPEVEVDMSNSGAAAFDVDGIAVTVRGFALLGSTSNEAIDYAVSADSGVVEMNVIGSRASAYEDPGLGMRNRGNLEANAPHLVIRNNLMSFSQQTGILGTSGADEVIVQGNELVDNGLGSVNGDGIAAEFNIGWIIIANSVIGTSSQGVVLTMSTEYQMRNNTMTANGIGISSGVKQSAGMTIRPGCENISIERNLIYGNYGAGLQVNNGAETITVTKNSFFDNGEIIAVDGSAPTNQVGIDLNSPSDNRDFGTAPFYTANDNGDTDAGANDLLNYPVLDSAWLIGNQLTVTGFARPGSLIEVFIADGVPSIFGEGKTFVFSATEGSIDDMDNTTGSYGPGNVNGLPQGTDNTNRFHFNTTVTGVSNTDFLTATATLLSNTSEFSGIINVHGQPTAVCRDIQVDLTATGQVSITAADVDNGSFGDGGSISLRIDLDLFNCADLGSNTVRLIVTDALGFTDTSTAQVTVLDPLNACGDNDGDGIVDIIDLDDDNDGILDTLEQICTAGKEAVVWWHNGTTESTILDTSLVATASAEVVGPGLNSPLYTLTRLEVSGVDAHGLQDAIDNDDYLEYAFTTDPTLVNDYWLGSIIHFYHFAPNRTNYRFAVIVSDDGFATSTILLKNDSVLQGLGSVSLKVIPEFYQLLPNTTYTFRTYLYAAPQITGGTVVYDDFRVVTCSGELDTDEDQVLDHLDLDADNDGIYDALEASHNQVFTSGVLNGGVDSFGIPLFVSNGLGGLNYVVADSDMDGAFDFVELDADADGCLDVLEAGYTDANNDGQLGSTPITVDPVTGVVTSVGP